MPRNPKCRKICLTPSCRIFQGAAGHADRGYVDQLPCALYLPAGSKA